MSTLRFDAMSTIGPAPLEQSVIEKVICRGRHIDIQWDDGIILSTSLRFTGQWHLYRVGEQWRKETHRARVVIEVSDWVAVCFDAAEVETFRAPNRGRHPQSGGVGPNISQVRCDMTMCTRNLLQHHDQSEMVVDVLADESVISGLGNVARSETLWAVGLSPFAKIGDLSYEDCETLVETAARISRLPHDSSSSVYGRNGHRCARCHGTIECKVQGMQQRAIFWCPDCQQRLDRRLLPTDLIQGDNTPTHPAELLFISDAIAARKKSQIVNDVRDFG